MQWTSIPLVKEGRKGKVATGVDLGKGCRGCAPPLPEMTCDCFIGVEVKHETKLRNSCEIQQPLKIICILETKLRNSCEIQQPLKIICILGSSHYVIMTD